MGRLKIKLFLIEIIIGDNNMKWLVFLEYNRNGRDWKLVGMFVFVDILKLKI